MNQITIRREEINETPDATACAESVLEGTGLPSSVRAHLLADAGSVEPLALGLTLQVGSGAAGGAAIGELLALQRSDGSFGSVGATAASVGGLEHARTEEREAGLRAEVDAALERALAWIRSVQAGACDPSSGLPRGLVGAELDTIALLWQLGRSPLLWEAVDVAMLLDAAASLALARTRAIAPILADLEAGLWWNTPEAACPDAFAPAAPVTIAA